MSIKDALTGDFAAAVMEQTAFEDAKARAAEAQCAEKAALKKSQLAGFVSDIVVKIIDAVDEIDFHKLAPLGRKMFSEGYLLPNDINHSTALTAKSQEHRLALQRRTFSPDTPLAFLISLEKVFEGHEQSSQFRYMESHYRAFEEGSLELELAGNKVLADYIARVAKETGLSLGLASIKTKKRNSGSEEGLIVGHSCSDTPPLLSLVVGTSDEGVDTLIMQRAFSHEPVITPGLKTSDFDKNGNVYLLPVALDDIRRGPKRSPVQIVQPAAQGSEAKVA